MKYKIETITFRRKDRYIGSYIIDLEIEGLFNSQTKKKKKTDFKTYIKCILIWVWWFRPIISATQETKTGGHLLPEVRD